MISISQELYKQLINSNLEDSLKNELVALHNANIETYDKNFMSIRILSQEEYNKYIIEGTCDGSIIKKDKQVWNYINHKYGWFSIYTGYTDISESEYLKYANSTANVNNKYLPEAKYDELIKHVYAGNYYNVYPDFTLYGELIIDNTNDNFSIHSFDYNRKMEILGTDNYGYFNKISTSIYDIKRLVKKTQMKISTSLTAECGISGRIQRPHVQATINHYCCYRPVFQYVDNNKSQNIFS